MGDETPERTPVTPLTWIGHDTVRGLFWFRCGQQYIRDHPSREWISNRDACFTNANAARGNAEHQWRYFMLYVAHLRVSGEL